MKPWLCGNFDAAKGDVIALAEGMHVEPAPAAHVDGAGPRACDQIGHGQIPGCGDFHIFGGVLDKRHRKAGPFGDGGVIGEIGAARLRRGAMRFEDFAVVESLRRLRAPQAFARHGSGDLAAFAALQRVGDGRSRDGAVENFERGDGACDAVRRNEGPRGVMDQHGIGRERLQRLKPRRDRKLARRSAWYAVQKLNGS